MLSSRFKCYNFIILMINCHSTLCIYLSRYTFYNNFSQRALSTCRCVLCPVQDEKSPTCKWSLRNINTRFASVTKSQSVKTLIS